MHKLINFTVICYQTTSLILINQEDFYISGSFYCTWPNLNVANSLYQSKPINDSMNAL